MKIQSRIILTSFSFLLILLISFGATIYYFSKGYIDNTFRNELEHRANIVEKITLEKNLISNEEYTKIYKEYVKKLPDEKIYNIPFPYVDDSLINSNNNLLPKEFITELLETKSSFHTSRNSYATFGKEYIVNNKKWMVIISATDNEGSILLGTLKNIILLGTLIISLISIIVSYFLSKSILKPIKNKIYTAMNISSNNLHERINIENEYDEIGQLTIAFNRMLDRLEESFKLQSSFISNASHEIKNPLTMISGTAEIALLKDRSVEEYKKTLESILQDSDSLNSLVNQLFLLAKTDISYDKLPKNEFSSFDLFQVLNDQNKKLYPKIIKVIVSDNSKGAILYGNKDLLISAIQNLVDNAVKFSKGEEVIIETSRIANNLKITITDKGPGVKEQELEKITSAFFRSESVRNIEGHGIGLALTKKIVDLHNGGLSFKNKRITSGLSVEISLPLMN